MGAGSVMLQYLKNMVSNDATVSSARVINISGFVPLDCGHNNVGSFCFALNMSNSNMSPGATYAGSQLTPSGAQMGGTLPSYGGLAGTWRCLGYAPYGGTSSRTATLFQRIS